MHERTCIAQQEGNEPRSIEMEPIIATIYNKASHTAVKYNCTYRMKNTSKKKTALCFWHSNTLPSSDFDPVAYWLAGVWAAGHHQGSVQHPK